MCESWQPKIINTQGCELAASKKIFSDFATHFIPRSLKFSTNRHDAGTNLPGTSKVAPGDAHPPLPCLSWNETNVLLMFQLCVLNSPLSTQLNSGRAALSGRRLFLEGKQSEEMFLPETLEIIQNKKAACERIHCQMLPSVFVQGSQNALFQSNSQIRLMKVTEPLLGKCVTHPKAHLTPGISSGASPWPWGFCLCSKSNSAWESEQPPDPKGLPFMASSSSDSELYISITVTLCGTWMYFSILRVSRSQKDS